MPNFHKLFLVFLISFYVSFAQERSMEYMQHLSIYEGLAHNGVTSILEDSKGYLWFGTYDGLNRYDGYSFKTFKNTSDKKILASNRVRIINEDEKGNLWIGTDEGLTIYNYEKQLFKTIYSNKLKNKGINGPIIRKILFDNELGLVLCATEGNGLLIFNEDYTFENNYTFSTTKNNFIEGIKLDTEHYLFSTSEGFITFNIKTKEFKTVKLEGIKPSFPKCSIVKIDEQTLVVTLNFGIGIIKYKKVNNTFDFELVSRKLQPDTFNSISIDKLNNLWLGTVTKGFLKINNLTNFLKGEPYKTNSFSLIDDITRTSSIVASTNIGCWVSTFNEGVFQFNIEENMFKYYNSKMNLPFGIKSNDVTDIADLGKGKFFITASFGGIGLFNSNTEKFEPFPYKLSENDILGTSSVFVDSKQNTWLTINNRGLFRVKYGSTSVEKISSKNVPEIGSIRPRSFAEDKYGAVWIGTELDVFRISVSSNNEVSKVESFNNAHAYFKNYKLNLIRRIYADPQYDFMWIGTDTDGLFRLKISKSTSIDKIEIEQFSHDRNNKNSLSSNFVSSIKRLPNGEMWVGTEGGGLCNVKNSDSKPEFFSISEKEGLSNNVVKSITFDNNNNLWVATNIGLNKIDLKDLSIRKFTKEDGLPFEDFGYASTFVDNKTMMLSGLGGFCYFEPSKITDEKNLPKLAFEDLKIFNNIVYPGDTINNRILLENRLDEMKEISLKYNENVFSLEIISLHYTNSENHKLRYRLLPINEEWIEVTSDQKNLQYSGLQSGTYELNVMVSDAAGNWTLPKKLTIKINPPFWKTTVAYLFYFLLLVLIIYVIGRVILKIQSLNHKVEIEQIEINSVKEINSAKLQFFSNISHEIKTPLTLISGPIFILLNRFKGNQDVKEKLEIVQRQSKKISQLIDQVHDFQRADANLLKMHYSTFSFDTFIQELIFDFKFMASNDAKILELLGDSNEIFVSADKDKLEKIFNNLLNNAFKYTKPNDSIKITYKRENSNLLVYVEDTGRGIDQEDIEHIFERFYQSQKGYSAYTGGSGIGLAFSKRLVDMHYGYINAESTLNEGSKFTVCLPIVKSALTIDEQETELKILSEEKTYSPQPQFEDSIDVTGIETNPDFKNSKIFFAEDNCDMRKFVVGILSNFFRVKAFSTGKECLNAMENEWPDIVISDVLMPEINGFELCKQLKTDIKTSHIPVILLTASTSIEDQLHGLKDGADAYIKKPFNIQYLVTRIESILQSRKLLRERYNVELPFALNNDEENTKDNVFLEKLFSLMTENFDDQELDLDNFAKELYLNRTHFYQKVKVLTNQTPYELLKEYRLKKAAEYLVQNKYPVGEVFLMTGFKSKSHFTKIFKEKYNITPGKYAAQLLSKFN